MQDFSKKIIIAEKYLRMLEKCSKFLAREVFEVYAIKTNTEALLLQRKIRADLIVTGLDIPGMSGEELCDLIRNDEELRTVSIIIVCNKEPGEATRCSSCRANAFLSVDAAPQVFTSTVRKLLSVSERSSIRVPVSVRIDGRDKRGKPFLGFSENLSASGMLVESERKLEMGDIITCSFYLDNNMQIITNAEVVRVNLNSLSDRSNQYGIMFTGLTGGIIEAIEAYVKNKATP